jgi:hypothetical protein
VAFGLQASVQKNPAKNCLGTIFVRIKPPAKQGLSTYVATPLLTNTNHPASWGPEGLWFVLDVAPLHFGIAFNRTLQPEALALVLQLPSASKTFQLRLPLSACGLALFLA